MHRRQALELLMAALPALAGSRPVWAGQWLPSPAVPEVPLLDHLGREVDLVELMRQRPVVVNFFFTGCGTVCPPQTALLREASRQWRQRPALNQVLVISISVDALGDGPKQLQAYADRFALTLGESQGWVMLSGEVKPLAKVLAAFDVPAGRVSDHPALLWLGDESRSRWTRTSSLNSPATVTRLLEALVS